MRLELEPPFAGLWRIAYLLVCTDDRRRVFLYNSHDDRAGLSYARYLMCVKHGRMLDEDEHVDHIDEDKTNDNIDNLQILTPEENKLKNQKWRIENGRALIPVILECPVCNEPFIKPGSKVKKLMVTGVRITCSKRCSAKQQWKDGRVTLGSRKKILSPEQHALIVELRAEGKSDYEISDISGISRPKLHRYRKEMDIS